jgi:hypothetical protein
MTSIVYGRLLLEIVIAYDAALRIPQHDRCIYWGELDGINVFLYILEVISTIEGRF